MAVEGDGQAPWIIITEALHEKLTTHGEGLPGCLQMPQRGSVHGWLLEGLLFGPLIEGPQKWLQPLSCAVNLDPASFKRCLSPGSPLPWVPHALGLLQNEASVAQGKGLGSHIPQHSKQQQQQQSPILHDFSLIISPSGQGSIAKLPPSLLTDQALPNQDGTELFCRKQTLSHPSLPSSTGVQWSLGNSQELLWVESPWC